MGKYYVTPWHGSKSIFVLDPADSGKSAIDIGENNLAVECPYCRMKNESHKLLVRGVLFDEVQKVILDDKYYDGKTFWFNDSWQTIYQTKKNQSQNVIEKFYAHFDRYNHCEFIGELKDGPVIVRRGDAKVTKRKENKKSE